MNRCRVSILILLVFAFYACSDGSGTSEEPEPAADAGTDTASLADSAAPDTALGDTASADTGTTEDTATQDAAMDTAEADVFVNPSDTPALPPELVPRGDEFMVVVLPDTQVYTSSQPEIFESQLKWIAERAAEYRIVFVSHVGDIVQGGNDEDSWILARAGYDWLDDIDLPYGFSIGAHDNGFKRPDPPYDNSCSNFGHIDCDAVDFKAWFGADRYEDRTWYGGASPSGLSSYQLVEVDDIKLLFLHMIQDTPAAEVEWAHTILDANPGTLAHLTTHRYLFDYRLTNALPAPLGLITSGRFNEATYSLGGQELVYKTSVSVQELFTELISVHPNIWGVHCGHVDAEFRQRATNSAGLPVHEVLVDFQNMEDGGGGWLRLLRFKPSTNQIEVVTFSTLTGELRGNGDGFDHSIDILEDYKNDAIDILEQFGLSREEIDAYLERLREEGTDERMRYFDSLYSDGSRDSQFTLDVDFQAYIEASR